MKRSKHATQSLSQANKRAEALIEALLKEMQRGVKDHALLESPEWERLFGAKQSIVVNVLKLVQAMASLPSDAETQLSKTMAAPEGGQLSDEEMRMLTAWLAEGRHLDQ